MIIGKPCKVQAHPGRGMMDTDIILVNGASPDFDDAEEVSYSSSSVYEKDVYFTLESDIAGSIIYFTTDGTDPLTSITSRIYPSGSSVLIKNTRTRTITVRAIARKDNAISDEVSFKINLLHSCECADAECTCQCGCHEEEEEEPEVTVKPFAFVIEGLESELVENIVYPVRIVCTSGSGRIKCENCPSYIMGFEKLENYAPLQEGKSINLNIMASPCRSENSVQLEFRSIDDATNTTSTFTAVNVSIVIENDQYPYSGARIMWKKKKGSSFYNIYSCGDDDKLKLVVTVPEDKASGAEYQWYLDRNGTSSTRYSVSAIDASGSECEPSLPRHAPNSFDKLCLIQGSLSSLGATPMHGIPIAYRIKDMTTISGTFVGKGTNLTYTDKRGYFEFTVPQSCIITLVIDDAGFNRSLVIPSQSSIDIEHLLQLPQNRM